MSNLYIPICAFFCSLLLVITFFVKKRVKNIETTLFSGMLITSFIDCILMIIIIYTAYVAMDNHVLLVVLNKLDYLQFLLWIWIQFLYIYYVLNKDDKLIEKKQDNIIKRTGLINGIVTFFIFFLPVELFNENNIMYSYGSSCNVMYVACAIYLIAIVILMAINYKKIFNRKFIPFYVFTLLATLVLIVRSINPGLVIVSAVLTYINLVMYHTIENPDVKLVDELFKNREIIERSSEEKSIFWFKISQELKDPVNNIKNEINRYLNERISEKEIDDVINNINENNTKMDYLISEFFEIGSSSKNNIVASNNSYNIYSLLEEIKKRIDQSNSNIDFNFYISNNIPHELSGDNVKLKQVLLSVINHSIDNTKEGFIHIDVNCISKFDLCRLIIVVKDSGKTIPTKKINEILSQSNVIEDDEKQYLDKLDVDIKLAYKLIKLINGTMYIKSVENKGTEYYITLDQIIKGDKLNSTIMLDKYMKTRGSSKSILIVDDDEKELRQVRTKLESMGYSVSISLFADDCLDRINNNEKYDIILIDDEMPNINGFMLFNKLQETGNDSKKIVMLDNSKEFIAKHYINDGFEDYILKNNLIKELETKL